MLGVWVPVLQTQRDRKDLADRAIVDAKRVLNDPMAKEEAKGQALLVQGLVLRNQEKFTEAEPVLKKAKTVIEDVGGRTDTAEAAKAGVADGYFIAGQVAEDLNDFEEAATQYRAPIKAHGRNDDQGLRYRAALARVLVKQPSRTLPAPQPIPPGMGKADTGS